VAALSADVPSLVVLTGAGVSAESGLATFRGAGGLWEGRRVEEVASPEGFAAQPVMVQRFYNERRAKLAAGDIAPNAAHDALARLDAAWPGEFLLVTQNVDDLHERAGSERLLHMHGELLKVRCSHSGQVFPWREAVETHTRCACCARTGSLRPHVVWFGEMPLGLDLIDEALARCDVFASIGTSGHVYPAAGYVSVARAHGARTLELNLESSQVCELFDEHRLGPASETVPAWVDELLAK
jgi:NAD-dependent deacetylase